MPDERSFFQRLLDWFASWFRDDEDPPPVLGGGGSPPPPPIEGKTTKQLTDDASPPVVPGSGFSVDDPIETSETEVDRTAERTGPPPTRKAVPPPQPKVLAALKPPPLAQAGRAQRLRLCMDFGTSACSVGWASSRATAVLANLSQTPGQVANTIESVFAVPVAATGQAVLGSYARNLQEDNNPNYVYYRSLKRLLSDGRSDPNAAKSRKRALTFVIEELLLLALAPQHSGTLPILEPDASKRGERAAELGFDAFPMESVPQHGIDLYLSVPNAFGAYECEIIKEAARKAVTRALNRIGAKLGWKDRVADRPPKMIREAEAVVWWELTRGRGKLDTQRILVFDVGGGSSDAALVAAARSKHSVSVKTLRHSGVTFGGNDVDELFLRSLIDHLGTPDALDKITTSVGAKNSRLSLLGDFEFLKASWSVTATNALLHEQGLADAWTAWLAQILQPDNATAEPIEGGSVDFQVRQNLPVMSHAHYQKRLGAFLRATVGAIVDDLFPPGGDDNQVDRVVVSGRGSLLPGLQEALVQKLTERGVIQSEDQVGQATPKGEDDRDYMKLACVRGICAASFDRTMERGLSHFVSHQITYSLGIVGDEVPVWPARTRLIPGGQARAVIRLTQEHEGLGLEFNQRRFPKSVDRYFPDSAAEWSSRLIGAITVPPLRDERDFLIQFDCSEWRLHVWELRKNGPPREIPDMLAQSPPGRRNPVTGLDFGWGDA